MTRWERLQSIPQYETFLKRGITSYSLEQQAAAMSDNDAAQGSVALTQNLKIDHNNLCYDAANTLYFVGLEI